MTETEVKELIRLSIPPTYTADKDSIASAVLSKVVTQLGRMRDVDWNKQAVNITLTSGDSSFDIGADILSDYGEIWGMDTLWHVNEDRPGVPVAPLDKFNSYARGNTQTGAPQIVTLHSGTSTLEVWPIPDKDYTLWAYVRKTIAGLEDIPSAYHDVVVDQCVLAIKAVLSPQLALQIGIRSLQDMMADSSREWKGSQVQADHGIHTGRSYNSDSGDLMGTR